MAEPEAILAEKMKARLETERERQRRWRERQKEKGLKSVSGMISEAAHEILQQEKQRTGERLSDILERAIRGLSGAIVETSVIDNALDNVYITAPCDCDQSNADDIQEAHAEDDPATILATIVEMRETKGLPFNEIARRMNAIDIPAQPGGGSWDGRKVYEIYKTAASG